MHYFTVLARVLPIALIDQTIPCDRFYTGTCMENATWSVEPPTEGDVERQCVCDVHLTALLRRANANGYSIRIGEYGTLGSK